MICATFRKRCHYDADQTKCKRKGKPVRKPTILVSLACILSVVLFAGCAGLAKGPTDEEQILGQIQSLKDALFGGEAEAILALFSEDFSHYEVPDKETLADYLEMGADMGYMDDLEEHDAEITWEEAEVTIDGDSATVYPIDASADMGAVTLELSYTKDADGVWRIVGADVEGI